MKNLISFKKEERGFVFVVALLIMTLLLIIGITANKTSRVETRIAGSDKTYKTVFCAADAGIEAGRAALYILKSVDSGNWDNLLAGKDLVGPYGGNNTLNDVIDKLNPNGRNVNGATYTLRVVDNNDLDGDPLVDTDNTIILISTATSYQNAQTKIQAGVRYIGAADEAPQERYGAENTGQAKNEVSAVTATNQRW
jgi:hypothetical protein